MKHFLPLLSLAALVLPAMAEVSPEVACEQLRQALERELAALESVKDTGSAAAALPALRSVLRELSEMDRSYETEKKLWGYIDNTEGVKQPLVELIQRLTIQFTRLEDNAFFNSAELRAVLSPQLRGPGKKESVGE